jgi:(2Fe-2S) ferredoxin
MLSLVVAVAAAASLFGLGVRLRRQILSRSETLGISALVVLAAGAGLLLSTPVSAILAGSLIAGAAALTEGLLVVPQAEFLGMFLWMAGLGALLALAVYSGGPASLVGAAVGMAAAWGAARRGGSRGAFGRRGARVKAYRTHLLVCVDAPCKGAGALPLYEAMRRERRLRLASGVRVTPCGCLGYCQDGPIVWAEPEGTLYRRVEPTSLETLWSPTTASEGAPE